MGIRRSIGRLFESAATGLKSLFNVKAMAVSCSVSLSGAMALPFLTREEPGAARPPPDTIVMSRLDSFPFLPRDAVISLADGTIVIDGFTGMNINKEGMTGGNLYAGPQTVIINTHGAGAGRDYSLGSDEDAEVAVYTCDISLILTLLNPETLIVVGCNPDHASPQDVAALIRRPDSRLKTVIMTEPGAYSIATPKLSFLMSYDNPLGRMIVGNANDPGVATYMRQAMDALKGEDDAMGPLIRYERTADGWADKGQYRGDNLFDAIDPLPVGWLRDAYNAASRGPDAVFGELREINRPDNSLTYWEKVSRNLDKPLMAPVLAIGEAGSRLWELVP